MTSQKTAATGTTISGAVKPEDNFQKVGKVYQPIKYEMGQDFVQAKRQTPQQLNPVDTNYYPILCQQAAV